MFGGREVGRRLRMRKFSMPHATENMPMVDETERGGFALAAHLGFVRLTGWLGSEVAGRLARWLKSHTAATASASCHPACCVALPALHAELSRR